MVGNNLVKARSFFGEEVFTEVADSLLYQYITNSRKGGRIDGIMEIIDTGKTQGGLSKSAIVGAVENMSDDTKKYLKGRFISYMKNNSEKLSGDTDYAKMWSKIAENDASAKFFDEKDLQAYEQLSKMIRNADSHHFEGKGADSAMAFVNKMVQSVLMSKELAGMIARLRIFKGYAQIRAGVDVARQASYTGKTLKGLAMSKRLSEVIALEMTKSPHEFAEAITKYEAGKPHDLLRLFKRSFKPFMGAAALPYTVEAVGEKLEDE